MDGIRARPAYRHLGGVIQGCLSRFGGSGSAMKLELPPAGGNGRARCLAARAVWSVSASYHSRATRAGSLDGNGCVGAAARDLEWPASAASV